MLESYNLQVFFEHMRFQLDLAVVIFDSVTNLLFLLVGLPVLRLQNEQSIFLQLFVSFQEQSFETDVSEIEVHVLDSGETKDHVKFLVFGLCRYVVLSPEAHFPIEVVL